MIGRNDACWCGSEKKWKKCHYPALSPTAFSQKELAQQYWKQHHILLKNEEKGLGSRSYFGPINLSRINLKLRANQRYSCFLQARCLYS